MLTPRQTGYITQAVKTSVAATLALYLAGLAQLPEPYWAAISAIIVMQSDLGVLVTTSINRLAGTAIGAVVGACAVFFWGTQLWSFALAVLCATLICAVISRWETYRFAGVTVAIVMLITHHGTPWIVGLHRFLEVSFGIVVAFVVTIAAIKLVNGDGRQSSQTKFGLSSKKKTKGKV
jgi:uncharacterized membrane protein YgaE (UPF0421/DUF939 family)